MGIRLLPELPLGEISHDRAAKKCLKLYGKNMEIVEVHKVHNSFSSQQKSVLVAVFIESRRGRTRLTESTGQSTVSSRNFRATYMSMAQNA
jgi:hypothetical protein